MVCGKAVMGLPAQRPLLGVLLPHFIPPLVLTAPSLASCLLDPYLGNEACPLPSTHWLPLLNN